MFPGGVVHVGCIFLALYLSETDCKRLLIQRLTSAFRPFLVALPLVATMPNTVNAQMPTMDDYNLGSGAIVKQVKTKSSNIIAKVSMVDVFAADDLADLIPYLIQSFTALDKLVQLGNWEEVVISCKNLDSATEKPYFGLNPEANTFLLDRTETRKLEDLREELHFVVDQLRDTAVSRRIYFFNRDDLAAVQTLTAELQSGESSTPVVKDVDQADLDEPKKLLLEAKSIARNIQKMINAVGITSPDIV